MRDYVCEWEGCGKSFITATRLKRHHATHEGKEKFRCSVSDCGQTFRKHGTLQKHFVTVHEGGKPYTCGMQDEDGNACGQGFDTAGKLHAHEGRVHGGKRFWCSICASDTSKKDPALDGSLKEDESGFSTYAKLQDHINTDHPPECSLCGYVCSSQRELKNHVEVTHGTLDVDERKTHLCPEAGCGRAFTKKWNLNVHIQSAHNSKKYICGEVALETLNRVEGWDGVNACGRALSTKGSLESHIRTAHMGQGRKRSTRRRQTKDSGQQHLLKLTGVGYDQESRRHIPCLLPDCNFRFGRNYDLQIHLVSQHGTPENVAKELVVGSGGDAGSSSAGRDVFPDDLMNNIDPNDWHMMDPKDYGDLGEEDISGGGQFWIGDNTADGEEQGDDGWLQDQMEMRMLIDGEDAETQGQDEASTAIDPFLC